MKWTGRLADGTAITGTGFLSQSAAPDRVLPVHMPLYKNTGSIHGWMSFSTPATPADGPPVPLTTGTLSWVKHPGLSTSKDRVYKSGIALHDLGITGSLYVPPAKTDILFGAPAGTDNFGITLADAGLNEAITKAFTLAPAGKLTLPSATDRPPLKSLSFNVAKGTFTGQISFSDPNPAKPYVRTVACQGVLLTAQQYGAGYFLLPQLPVSTPVQTTLTTSPVLSGDVFIEVAEPNE